VNKVTSAEERSEPLGSKDFCGPTTRRGERFTKPSHKDENWDGESAIDGHERNGGAWFLCKLDIFRRLGI